ncbi:Rpn family recombination-promoting nuclease/putative transposase [Bacillus cereus]|uniref:Signal transduction histidine kinase n=1 Tax=Bacillus cereus TaxID=1396 RepID=A0A164QLB1_BACCE|nr:Rpn family recombination-promoting nuclease/putative transposase [Bacillus cereus]KZD71860.1 Signal transduction histidine kinase [Bacillus cereus]
MKKKKTLSPKSDIVFKLIFSSQQNSNFLVSFLNAVLRTGNRKKIKKATIKNPINIGDKVASKESIMDIKAVLDDGTLVNVEIQLRRDHNMENRSVYYWSKLCEGTLIVGEEYDKIPPCIAINIVDYVQFTKTIKFHSVYVIKEEETNEVLTEIFEIHFVELKKFSKRIKGKNYVLNELELWLLFLLSEDNVYLNGKFKEALSMDGMEKHPVLKAKEKLVELSSNDSVREMVESREKFNRDQLSIRARENRISEEKGMKKGMKKGMEKGMKIGVLKEKINNVIENIEEFDVSDDFLINKKKMNLEQVQVVRKIIAGNVSAEEVARVFDIEVEDVPKIHDSLKNK